MSLSRTTRSAQSLFRAAQRGASRHPSTSSALARTYATTVESDIFKPTKYGGKYTVTLIPGDGIGAEVAEAVKTIFKADNVPIEWEQVDVSGVDTGNKHSEELFKESIASLRRNKIGLKGILHTPIERSGHQSFNVALRQELDIYASVVLIKNIPGLVTRHKNVDLCIVRENTEGEYSGLEHQSVSGVVESLKIITRAKSERIAKFAFSFALANNRKKVTCIHKANIMKLADGLFRNTVKRVGEDYPTLEVNDMIVDNASMQAVSRPQQFDVMVMPNLYGGILTNIAAALVGGPGVVPGCNMGREVAVFEPGCRHVGLDIKGKDQANPTALLLSGTMLLRHLGLDDHANRISKAVYDVIADGKVRTRDMGGNNTTHEYTRTILDKMEQGSALDEGSPPMTSKAAPEESGRTTTSQDVHHQTDLTLSRIPQPYHRRGDDLATRGDQINTNGTAFLEVPNGHVVQPATTSTISRPESSESGTEADDEKGPLLKGLPAPRLRARKGLRGSTPAGLTPTDSPLPTPPAFLGPSEFGFFDGYHHRAAGTNSTGERGGGKDATAKSAEFEEYKRRKRQEIIRRCTEVSLLCGIGATVWFRARVTTGLDLADWLNELSFFVAVPLCVYSLYPIRLTLRARARAYGVTNKTTLLQAARRGFHIPSRFDPGPLVYPVALPVMIALSLFERSADFLPAAIACGLSSMPSAVTATPTMPVVGEYLHWGISVLPLHASALRLYSSRPSKPVSLKIESNSPLTREDQALIFPLHEALLTVLSYLTTSSLDVSELHLLSTALIHLYLFSHTPQAEILKALLWLGGLCIFVSCKNFLEWEVALARIPAWKLSRKQRQKGQGQGLFSQIDQTICQWLVGRKNTHRRGVSSDSDDSSLNAFRRVLPRPSLAVNESASTSLPKGHKPVSECNTFTGSEFGSGKIQSQSSKEPKQSVTTSRSAAFLSFSLEQAKVRKYAYAAIVYFFVAAILLGPVRIYIGQRALAGHEPLGWALGYLLGNLPRFRLWVVSNNLDRWICLPAHTAADPLSTEQLGWIENARQYSVGPANTRLLLCAYYMAVLLCGITAVVRLTSLVQVDTRRKVFHGIMVIMLLPTIFVDPCFIALALGLVLAIFLLLDLFRASQVPPISKPLTTFLAPYVDGRDHRGPVIVSHIFLLIGCAIPLWLSLAAAPRSGQEPWSGWDTSIRDLSMVSGVICVGLGDAAASLIGRRYGKTKWCWAGGKSLEGSLAFALAVTCGLYISWIWLRLGGWADVNVSRNASDSDGTSGSFNAQKLAKCLVAGVGASLLESTLTAANDNVVVPVGLWLLVRGLDI
ncbi:Isocitrate dehydrogenase [NAD] subunit 1, mitochondrial [Exophiala dermatitidis]